MSTPAAAPGPVAAGRPAVYYAAMRRRDTYDVVCSAAAVAADAAAILSGFLLAEWVRFESGWIPMFHDAPPDRSIYLYGALLATAPLLLIFHGLGLYVRPQLGPFSEKVPRLVRAVGLGILLAMALAFAVRTEPPFSRVVVVVSLFTVLGTVLFERGVLHRAEIALARRSASRHRVLILGTDATAARLKQALEDEPRLHSEVTGFLRLDPGRDGAQAVSPDLVLGPLDRLPDLLAAGGIDRALLATGALPHDRIIEIILACDRYLVAFEMVPDLFRVLTTAVEVRTVDGIPLLGLRPWPLDRFWNRILKRAEDVAGALVGLVLSAPLVAAAAYLVKRSSPGPVFYRQERCGETGRGFTMLKLRSMQQDAESGSGPVWATENDPRCTPVGAWLRRWSIDELPQFWNVLRGDMSLVGPRPERPAFVEKFRADIGRYMWRHVSKPGMTGWAQVNGLRGNTDIRERITLDLYYLENWSLALDFKIILRTFFSRENAY